MDSQSLVNNLIDDGQKLVDDFAQRGFPLIGAFWLKASEDNKWYFYLITSVVDQEGLLQAYRRLHPFIYQSSEPLRIDPLEIKLIGPSNPVAQDVLAFLRRAPGPRGSPIRWSGTRLGNVSVEDAYVYLLPLPTP